MSATSLQTLADIGYTFERPLGRGAFGEALLVRCNSDGTRQAAKVAHSWFTDLEAEARAHGMCQAAGASHVVRAMRAGRSQRTGLSVLMLEYCDGGSVDAYIETKRSGTCDIGAVFVIACGAAAGLAEMSQVGLQHRDFKPANLLLVLDAAGRVAAAKVADLGTAVAAAVARETRLFGAAVFAAPELLLCGPTVEYTPAADVWALGVTLFELRFGYRPFDQGPAVQCNATAQAAMDRGDWATVTRCGLQSYWGVLEHVEASGAAASEPMDAAVCGAIRACLTWDAAERPTAAKVCAMLAPAVARA
jgi:serine/threonine protein kinase